MKSTSVRGTPVRHITNTAREGIAPGTPKGMSGTVNKQFEGDQKGNRQEGVASGTPYTSKAGNSDEFMRRRPTTGAIAADDQVGADFNNPRSNGNGVILDGISRDSGYTPQPERAMDSPVPSDAPTFDPSFIRQENLAHLGQGQGASPAQAADEILNIGGVLSRGMRGTSSSSRPEDELTDDDRLTGNTGSVPHEKE